MKTIKILFAAIILLATAYAANAQNYKRDLPNLLPKLTTITIKVNGVCDMCKHRIQNALKLDGIISASWNVDTKILSVTYNAKKINPDKIQEAITAVGHDTDKLKADDMAYQKLPDCCHYQRKQS